MTSRRKKKQQDGFIKKVSSLFNLDTVSYFVTVYIETFVNKNPNMTSYSYSKINFGIITDSTTNKMCV